MAFTTLILIATKVAFWALAENLMVLVHNVEWPSISTSGNRGEIFNSSHIATPKYVAVAMGYVRSDVITAVVPFANAI